MGVTTSVYRCDFVCVSIGVTISCVSKNVTVSVPVDVAMFVSVGVAYTCSCSYDRLFFFFTSNIAGQYQKWKTSIYYIRKIIVLSVGVAGGRGVADDGMPGSFHGDEEEGRPSYIPLQSVGKTRA